jgi:hypothetical protein
MTVRDLTELTHYANPGTLAYAYTWMYTNVEEHPHDYDQSRRARVPRTDRQFPGIGQSSCCHSARRNSRCLRKRPKTAHISELKEAADRLASALADVDEEELVAEFKELRRRGKGASR